MSIIMKYLVLLCIMIMVFSCLTPGNEQNTGEKEDQPLILIINYPYQIWSDDPTKIHVTLFKQDFTPAVSAQVKVDGTRVGTTDGNGTCIFDYKPASNQTHLLTAGLKEWGKYYTVSKYFTCNARTVSFKAKRLYVYTDRGVYNPGQDILIRILAWQLKREYSPISKTKIQLLFQDTKGKVFAGEYVTTNEFGVGSTAISLPSHIPEGDYDLVVLYEQARESTRLRIKRFRPPVINITHDLKRYFTPSSAEFHTKVSLSYFSGGKPETAALRLSFGTAKGREIFAKQFTSKTATFDISLDKQDLDRIKQQLTPETEVKLKLRASDGYGQSDEVVWDMTYTARPFYAVLETDKDAYPQSEAVSLLVKVVDLDGQPAAHIPLSLNIDSLQLKKSAETDDQGVASFAFPMPDRSVTAVIRSPIMDSPLGQRVIPFQDKKPMVSKVTELPKQAGMKTLITVRFDSGYVPVEKVVHVDFTDISGSLVTADSIPIRKQGDGYTAQGEVSVPTWGTMLVNLYCCAVKKEQSGAPYSPQTVGFITEGQHITFYPDRKLEITVDNFKPSYAPGEKAVFTISVSGGTGEKCLGVSITDAAVLSLLNPFIKQPFGHFYNPQAKVIATGGAGVLTWPVVDRNWGYPWRDIAYTNWGWKAPGNLINPQGSAKDAESNEVDEALPGATAGTEDKPLMEKSVQAEDATTTSADGRNRSGEKPATAPAPKIIIRTRFPETALWEPVLTTTHNKAGVQVTLPHEITTQKLTIMATDKHGYLGFVQKDIVVTQPLFIHSLFPVSFIRGDKITVRAVARNLSETAVSATASLESDSLTVIDPKPRSLTLQPGQSMVLAWDISASTCGKGSYRLSLASPGFKDIEEKKFTVLPATPPAVQTVKAEIKNGTDFSNSFAIDPAADYYTATLNVALPNVFPAFEAYFAFDVSPWYTPWAVSATVLMNTALLDYSAGLDKGNAFRDELLAKLNRAALLLTSSQLENGSWGFYPAAVITKNSAVSQKSNANLYYTLSCLRALCELNDAGISIDPHTISGAVRYIMNNRNKTGLWSSKDAFFWDVYNEETDDALSAEVFEVLAYALSRVPQLKNIESQMLPLKKIMLDLVAGGPQEPMTAAAALQGLMYLRNYYKDQSLTPVIKNGIRALIRLKRTAHWEPHWYHAYGGMVELNARILSLLAEFDPQGYEGYLREGITWLLSTREAWGAWHNEVGTANAVRALLRCGRFTDETSSVITIAVNNKQVARVDIDPADPFLAAAKLAYFEITPWLQKGKNNVRVSYNGALTASVILSNRQWSRKTPSISGQVSLIRTAPPTVSLEQPVQINLTLLNPTKIGFLSIAESLPSNCEPERNSLDTLVADGRLTGYTIHEGTLYLSLAGGKEKQIISYRIIPVRPGTSIFSATRVIDTKRGTVLLSVKVPDLTVR